MSDTNPAQAAGDDEALSVDAGADAISDLLTDPETDLQEKDQDQEGEPAEAEGEEPEAEGGEPTEDDTAEEKADPNYESGKFAADTANVRMKDGSVISVQELKRGWTSQQSFTRGTQENAKEREALASQKAEAEQYARTLQQHRDFLLQASQHFIPQPPDKALLDQNSASFNPIAYFQQKEEYDNRVAILNQLQEQAKSEQDRVAREQGGQKQKQRAEEGKKLLEAMPELSKPEVYSKFWRDAVETMAEYGFSQEELDGLIDHRFYKAMRDLSAYRKARTKLPAVKETIQKKPVLQGQRRMDPKDKTSREKQSRSEQLRRTGDFDAGVNALMDLDL